MEKKSVLSPMMTVLAFGVSVTALGMTAASAFAEGSCMQDIYTRYGGSGSLNCNSNDVRIAKADNITPIKGIFTTTDGKLACLQGDAIEFTADFTVVLGATGSVRYDIGLYIANLETGQLDALAGTCNSGTITGDNAKLTFDNEDGDACGDISGALSTVAKPTKNPQKVNLHIATKCIGATNSQVSLPNCTSWRQPGSNTTCTDINQAFPGSPSKCNCDSALTAPISVVVPSITVNKYANDVTSLNVDEPGANVKYTVVVHNTSATDSVALTQLTEDEFGDGKTVTTYDSASNPLLTSICNRVTLLPCGPNPSSCAAGSTATCTFYRDVSGAPGYTVTDKACVSGMSSGPVGPTCNTATVTVVGVNPSASVQEEAIKTVETFKVTVKNTSKVEQGSLKALCDDVYGPIADPDNICPAGSTSIISTTCGTAAVGALPVTLAVAGSPGDTYTCTFEAEVQNDTLGPQHATVTVHVGDDDGNSITQSADATVQVTTTHTP